MNKYGGNAMDFVNFIRSLNETNRKMVYHVLAENRSFTDNEWNDILQDICRFREKLNVADEIQNLLTYLEPDEKNTFENIIRDNTNSPILDKIYSFEDVQSLDTGIVKSVLELFDVKDLAVACMGTSPQNKKFIFTTLNNGDLESAVLSHNPMPLAEVEDMQQKILAQINAAL